MVKGYKIFGRSVASIETTDAITKDVSNILKKLGETPTVSTTDDFAEDNLVNKYDDEGKFYSGGLPTLYLGYFEYTSQGEVIVRVKDASNTTGYIMTGLIPVNGSQKFLITGSVNSTIPAVIAYNRNREVINTPIVGIPSIDASTQEYPNLPVQPQTSGTDKGTTIKTYNTTTDGGYFLNYTFDVEDEDVAYIRFAARGPEHGLNKNSYDNHIKGTSYYAGPIPISIIRIDDIEKEGERVTFKYDVDNEGNLIETEWPLGEEGALIAYSSESCTDSAIADLIKQDYLENPIDFHNGVYDKWVRFLYPDKQANNNYVVGAAAWSTNDRNLITSYIPITKNDGSFVDTIHLSFYSTLNNFPLIMGFKEIEDSNTDFETNRVIFKNKDGLILTSKQFALDVETNDVKLVSDNKKPDYLEVDSAYTQEYSNIHPNHTSDSEIITKVNVSIYPNKFTEDLQDIKYIRVCGGWKLHYNDNDNDGGDANVLVYLPSPLSVSVYNVDDSEDPEKNPLPSKKSVKTLQKEVQEAVLDEVTNNLKEEQDIVSTIQVLKNPVRDYLNNVNYGNTSAVRNSEIKKYLYDNKGEKYVDCDEPNYFPSKLGGVIISNSPEIKRGKGKLISSKTHINEVPNKRYYYVYAYGDPVSELDILGTRRFIYANNIRNVRDLGGIKCNNGNSIAFDKIFRGSEFDGNVINANPDCMKYLNRELNITAELDLRNESEILNRASTNIISRYKNIPFIQYRDLVTLNTEKKRKVKEAFEFVAEQVRMNRKVYIHCAWGYHRAGLMSSIIEGVLGAYPSEIDKDYELSSFSNFGSTTAEGLTTIEDTNYKAGYEAIQNKYNGSWINMLIDCGVSQDTIDDFRKNMLLYPPTDDIQEYFEVTYSELVNLRNNKTLVSGAKYRMIDYDTVDGSDVNYAVCSGVPDVAEFKSAYKHFDLLLTALSSFELDSNVKALHSARDTEGYFNNTDLSEWELKYCLDNNKDKYSWASENGKGVIYWMKDENRNEAPYDFKNTLFKVGNLYVQTFGTKNAFDNKILPYASKGTQYLSKNVFIPTNEDNVVKDNLLSYSSHNNILYGDTINCKIGEYSSNNILTGAENCVIGADCVNIEATRADYLYVGNGCYNIHIDRSEVNKFVVVENYVYNQTIMADSDNVIIRNDIMFIESGTNREQLITETEFNNIFN